MLRVGAEDDSRLSRIKNRQHDNFVEEWARILSNHTSLQTQHGVSCV